MMKMFKETDVSLASLRRGGDFIRGASAEAVSVRGWNQLNHSTAKQPSRGMLAARRGRRLHAGVDSAPVPRLRPEPSARTPRTKHTAAHVMTSVAGTVCPRRNKSNAAFTLIELLAVVLIILILAGVVAGVSSYMLTAANKSRIRAEIVAISLALENYKLDRGAYPPASGIRAGEEYKGLLQLNTNMTFGANSQKKIYMTFTPRQFLLPNRYLVDPWGNFYGYRYPGKYNTATFDLWSYGPDGRNGQDPRHTAGGVDDLTNWR